MPYLILIGLCSFSFLTELVSSLDCRNSWYRVKSCMKERYDDYSPLPYLSNNRLKALENEIQTCYTRSQCKNPLPSSAVRDKIAGCYRVVRNILVQNMQTCVAFDFPDFDMPEEDESSYFLAKLRYNLMQAEQISKLCSDDRKRNEKNKCLQSKLTNFLGKKGTEFAENFCTVRSRCEIRVEPSSRFYCYIKFQQGIVPKLCRCAQHLPLIKLLQTYAECVRNTSSSNSTFGQDTDGDFNVLWFSNSVNRWCANQEDQCARASIKQDFTVVGDGRLWPAGGSTDQFSTEWTSHWSIWQPPRTSSASDGWQTSWNSRLATPSWGTDWAARGTNSAKQTSGWTTQWSSNNGQVSPATGGSLPGGNSISGGGSTGENSLTGSVDVENIFGQIGVDNLFGNLLQHN